MKQLYLIVLAFLFHITGQAQQSFEVEYDGVIRSYIVYLPSQLPEDAPLVFVLHGYTSQASTIMNYSGMNAVAEANGFAVCYPQGLGDIFGIPHWNANLEISEVDDIGFLAFLAGQLQESYNLDAVRTFVCGMSNGGFMSYTLACERPDVFSAIASVTGTMSGYDWQNCNPDNPVPVMQISGTADNVVPIDGSMSVFGGWGGAPGMEAVRDFWIDQNECSENEMIIIDANFSTSYNIYADGIDDQEVWNYLIDGWGHSWPTTGAGTGFDASTEIWRFFEKSADTTTDVKDIASLDAHQLSVFPNPAFDYIETNSAFTHYDIYNASGTKVQSGLNNNGNRIDISQLGAGYYILQSDVGQQGFIKTQLR